MVDSRHLSLLNLELGRRHPPLLRAARKQTRGQDGTRCLEEDAYNRLCKTKRLKEDCPGCQDL